jgi:ureidoglycolate lyase
LVVEPLTRERFAPFGELIDTSGDGPRRLINAGFAERFDGLADIDTGREGGQPALSIFRARPRQFPMRLWLVERHLLGSQTFMPLAGQPFLVVVAAAGEPPSADRLHCFLAAPGQGVNLAAGTWHHPLLAVGVGGDFLVIERCAPGDAVDCDEFALDAPEVWIESDPLASA